jgi:peptidoglycan/LPS O-acetylase OafA/YrhL
MSPRVNLGHEAVVLFFIISGFVVTMSLDRAKSLVHFAAARFARLFPVFWAAITLTFLVAHVADLPGYRVTVTQAFINSTMMPSVFGVPPVDVVYWTLTVELFFYIHLATLVALGLRSWLPFVSTAFVMLGLVDEIWDIESVLPFGGYRLRSYLNLPFWHLFFAGIILYNCRSKVTWWHFPALLLCLAAAAPRGEVLMTASLVAGVFIATTYPVPCLTNRVLLFLGSISYSFYSIHANIGYVILKALYRSGYDWLVAIPFTLMATLALATFLCFAVEKPSHRALRRLLSPATPLGRSVLVAHPPDLPAPIDGSSTRK